MCLCSWCRDTGVAAPAIPTPGRPVLPGGTVPRKEAARGLPVMGTCQPSGWERGGLAESPCRPSRLPAPPHVGMRANSRARAVPSPGRGPLAGARDFPRKALVPRAGRERYPHLKMGPPLHQGVVWPWTFLGQGVVTL